MQLKFVKSLPNGLEYLFLKKKQLSSSNAQKILLAEVSLEAKNIVLRRPTDTMDDAVANALIDFITAKEHNWTIIVSSKIRIGKQSVQEIQWKGTIILDQKNNLC
jgi:ABC-type sugar transport system ATPase subunit